MRAQTSLLVLDLLLERRQPAVLQLGGLGVVPATLRALDLDPHLFELFLQLAAGEDRLFFLLPVAREAVLVLLEIGQLLFELLQPFLGGLVGLLLQRLTLDLELHDAPLDLVELGRHRVDLHAQARGGLVDEVDGLVGKEAIGDVAIGEHGRRHQRRVLEPDAVMDLVALPQPAQDADRVLDARFADDDRLEAPLERGILLDVLAVLVERRCANRMQLAARQHRLEHVGRVHGAFRGAGADDGVELVDEENDLAGGIGDFLEDRLQPLFELAAVLCAGNERAHVQGDNLLVLQPLGHVLPHDALGQAFDDGGLADAGFADEDGIVLGPARQHLNHPADLVVATDDRVELALARELGEVAPVALERLIRGLGVLAGDALRAAHRRHRLKNRVLRDATLLEEP